jgi:hypothetical protein
VTDPALLSLHLRAVLSAALTEYLPGVDLARVDWTPILDDEQVRRLCAQCDHEQAMRDGEKIEALVAEIQGRDGVCRRMAYYLLPGKKKPAG